MFWSDLEQKTRNGSFVGTNQGVTSSNLQATFVQCTSVLSLKIDLILAISADTDQMPHSVAFHLGLHCLP